MNYSVAALRGLKYVSWGQPGVAKKVRICLPVQDPRRPRSGLLALVVTVKNEAEFLPEWVAFHLLSGAEHIYIYDNNSTDNPRDALQKFIQQGVVTFVDWKIPWTLFGNIEAHHAAFADAIIRFGRDWRWMAFLDADEFLFAVKGDGRNLSHLRTLLETLRKYPVIAAYWTMFGTNGHQKNPSGLVIENYLMHAPFPFLSSPKVICDPLSVRGIWSSHMFDTDIGRGVAFDERGRVARMLPTRFRSATSPFSDALRLHHYYVRSRQDAEKKVSQRREHWSERKVAKLESRISALEANCNTKTSSVAAFVEPVRDLVGRSSADKSIYEGNAEK